jgi:hypothetical protein
MFMKYITVSVICKKRGFSATSQLLGFFEFGHEAKVAMSACHWLTKKLYLL